MADKPPANSEKPLRKWLLWCGVIAGTLSVGASVRPMGEFLFTMDLRKEVADMKLQQFSDIQIIKSDLKTIKDQLKNRDEAVARMAIKALREYESEIVRNP